MNKAEITRRFHQIADHLLLGAGNWPLSSERLEEFWKWVRECGLEEDTPDSGPGTSQASALGREINLYLMMTFIGAFEIWEFHPFSNPRAISLRQKRTSFGNYRRMTQKR